MLKSLLVLYLVLCWLSLYCFCDDVQPDDAKASGDNDDADAADEEANKALGITCNDLSTSEMPDAQYLQKNVLSKDATVKVQENGYFIVQHGTAAVVTRQSGEETTTTHAHLRQGINAIMSHCKADDNKISGDYTPKDKKSYRICLTGSEETDDC